MKKSIIVLLPIFFILLIIGYSYHQPNSFLGVIYLHAIYDESTENLNNIHQHLENVNGGYLPNKFDEFLFNELSESSIESIKYKNIIGFYALQSSYSHQGELIINNGDTHILNIIEIGLSSSNKEISSGCLFLSFGIVNKRVLYKPQIDPSDIKSNLELMKERKYNLVRVHEAL